jgi:heme A synthase
VSTAVDRFGPTTSGIAAGRRFERFAWAVLAYNILVVLWGAYVRATGSGAGCGSHWPLCNGEVVPRAPRAETIIEFTHRLTSGVALLAVIGLCVWAFRAYPRNHGVRISAALSLVFIVVEALLGAGLVLFQYVAENASAARAVYLSAHLSNTLILLGLLAATAWYAKGAATKPAPRGLARAITGSLFAAMAVAITGAVAALGDTLYPAASLSAGVQADFVSGSPALLRLRLIHPAVAAAGGMYILVTAAAAADRHRMALIVAALVVLQLAAGVVNILLLAPVWMQLVHLLLADLLWILLVLLYLESRPTLSGTGL